MAADRAARAIREKAERQLARAAGRPDEGERRRRAEAIQRIAARVELGLDAVRGARESGHWQDQCVHAVDLKHAANEVYSLALRRGEEAAQRQLKDLPVTRATIRGAVALYDLAISLHRDEFWEYSRGLLHDSIAESATDGPEPTPQDAVADRAATAAQVFAELLVDRDFDAAKTMLASQLRQTTSNDLRMAYESMTRPWDESEVITGDVEVFVMTSDADMPGLGSADLAWVYVVVSGESFNEAISVVVTEEAGEARIRELEWGRP